MANPLKIGRNDPCPCGNLKKYKHCCEGKLDWRNIVRSEEGWIKHLSIRGRNLFFANRLSEILQLDSREDLSNYKKAFTASAVRDIHEALEEIWPPSLDIEKVLASETGDVSGLYIGDYSPDYILRGIVRHAVYANKILVVDPFLYPSSVREQFNPVINPDQYRSQTLKNANFWYALLPWIRAGIVEIIRTPSDFDHKLQWASMERQRKKFEENENLRQALEKTTKEMHGRHFEKQTLQMMLLSAPDSYLERKIKELGLETEGHTSKDFVAHVQRLRDNDPNFLLPFGPDMQGQLHMMTSGASYDIAKLTASITNSYLVTDLHSKWKELEMDRDNENAESLVWSPFAKAIQNAPFKYLNSLDLKNALELRLEGRLESMRSFLMRVWRAAAVNDSFDERNARLLAEELHHEVAKANIEWGKIDDKLARIFGAELGAGLLAAGPLVASGHGIFVAAAAVTAGVVNLASTTVERKRFQDKHPAAFFMEIDTQK